jgi:hypothetical protein
MTYKPMGNLSTFLALIILINISSAQYFNNMIYPLANNQSISLSDIVNFQNNIVSEYNKNFESIRPENEKLYYLFVFNKSFNSTVILTYYGNVEFVVRESKLPKMRIFYLDKDHSFNDYLNDNIFYGRYKFSNYKYDFWYRVDNLTFNTAQTLAHDYFVLDWGSYLDEKAILARIDAADLEIFNRSVDNLVLAYQSGDPLEKVDARVQVRELADKYNISEPRAKEIFDERINQTEKTRESASAFNWFILRTIAYLMILGLIFIGLN